MSGTYTPARQLRYQYRHPGQEHDAQDAVQQTFNKARQRRHTLREGENNIRAWLKFRIATVRRWTCCGQPNALPTTPLRSRWSRTPASATNCAPPKRAVPGPCHDTGAVLDGHDYVALLARIHGCLLRPTYAPATAGPAKLAAILKEVNTMTLTVMNNFA